ncbi:MAG: J domain-containing protein [Betaproteobacteria bacterium]|nr:J domain-containing protein [Betaproteobacteria bacterium]
MTDPYRVLGVPPTADDEAIRAAYLAAIRAHPPERDRQRFEQVRAAYEAIASEDARLAHELFDTSLPGAAEVLDLVGTDFQPRRPDLQRLRRVLGAT